MWKQGLHRLGIGGSILSLLAALAVAVPASAQNNAEQPDPEAVFATVNGTVITIGEYARELRRAARNSFYHGQPPDGDMAGFQRQVADKLVERLLMAAEARRRGIEPDSDRVEEALGQLAAKGASDEALQVEHRRLERDSLVGQLEARVQELDRPSREEVRAFYEANPELFTEPTKLRLSVILLQVMPDDPQSVWRAAREEAQGLLKRLREGADFAESARIHSADNTAVDGGDMGYVHLGMVAPEIEQATREMQPGDISEPLTVLEGIALVRFEDRREPALQDFTDVAERAEGLLQSRRSEEAVTALRESLRQSAELELREELLEPEVGNVGNREQG